MNSNKYKNSIYETRDITDLRDMVRQSVRIFGDKAAYLEKQEKGGEFKPVSYRKFGADIDALGTSLINQGFKDRRIGVIGENSYRWVVSYLAVTNGVGVIVPFDKELPTPELSGLMARSEVAAVITSKKSEEKVREAVAQTGKNIRIISMAGELDSLIVEGNHLLDTGHREYLDAEIDPEAMSILLFTSGTTGLAKGVMLSHKNIAKNTQNMSKYVDIGIDGIGLSVLPMHHTFEMTCHIMTSIYQGLTVAICEGLKYITKNMEEAHVTHMLGVPLIFEQMHKKIMKQANQTGKADKLKKGIALSRKMHLYNHPEITKRMFADIHKAFGGHMRLFIAGGAAIDPKIIEDFEAMGIAMFQGYGMTENAPIIAVNRDRCGRADAAGFVMQETEVRIINKDEKGMGEIICRGPSVMLGYYDNPEETEAVLKNGWLHTGDYGRMDKDGYLYIMGRKKNVIVTKNGKNIFPEEVEYYLLKSDFIEEVLVLGEEDEKSGDTVIKAIIYPNFKLLEDMGHMSDEEMEKFFKSVVDKANEEMPSYKMVKRIAIRKTEFEKTTTRKIKRFVESNLK